MFLRVTIPTACLVGLICLSGCKSEPSTASATSVTSATSATSAASAASAAPVKRAPELPSGPRLAILAGHGVGPIRFGATVATIERLMGAPCEMKLPDKCRYITHGIEFDLKDGAVDRMVISRFERPAGPDATGTPRVYGFFNGMIPPDLAFGMKPSVLLSELGTPLSTEKVTTKNDNDTIQRDTYPGMVVEYDRYRGGVILGGVILTKADVNPTPAIPTAQTAPAPVASVKAERTKKKN